MKRVLILVGLSIAFYLLPAIANGQLQQSGGGGSAISALTLGGNAVTAQATGELNTNLGRVGGTAVDTNSGNKSAGTLRVVLATDQPSLSNALAVSQSGTWNFGVSAGSNLIGTVVQKNSCGTTAFDSGITENVSTGAGTDLATSATCVQALFLSNTTGSAVNVTVKDKSGTPKTYINSFSLPANSNMVLPLWNLKFVGGLTVVAGTGSALNAQVVGYQ